MDLRRVVWSHHIDRVRVRPAVASSHRCKQPSTRHRRPTGLRPVDRRHPNSGRLFLCLEKVPRARGVPLSRRQRGAACSDEAAPNTSRTVQGGGGGGAATDAMRETVDGHGGAGGRSFSRCRRRHSIGHEAVVTSHIPRPLRTHAKAGRAAPSDGRTDG